MYFHPPAFHSNFKILIVSLLGFSSIFAISCVATSVFLLVEYAIYKNACDLLFKSWIPVLIRAPIYFYIYGIALWHCALFLERLLATYFCNAYETAAGKSCGISATVVLWFVSFASFFYVFCGEDYSNTYRTFISSTNQHNASKVFLVSSLCAVLDILSICFDFLLYRYNKKLENSNALKWLSYRLRRSYQIRENQRTIQLMLYLSVVHSIIYLTYAVSNLIIRKRFEHEDPVFYITLLEAFLNIISMHVLTMLGILHYYLKYSRQQRKFIVEDIYAAKDMYFIQFRQQLEGIETKQQDKRQALFRNATEKVSIQSFATPVST
ncbi:7TM GPCR domain containing protein [Aphelenchoides bicaudatus]|nr:7TM GPCR domain containing protein [Aphelenchoides bicaudatus]